ncbi:hypothetical protein [Neptuniibacter sp.]|uniref:hypothetical protein n=1 Tax=Neptuniibacter sp. TaxID=1962643 RepID=UPI003B5A37CE
MRRLFHPKNTLISVASEIEDGLIDGSVVVRQSALSFASISSKEVALREKAAIKKKARFQHSVWNGVRLLWLFLSVFIGYMLFKAGVFSFYDLVYVIPLLALSLELVPDLLGKVESKHHSNKDK